MPITVIVMAVVFNLGNGYLNGRYVFHFSGGRYAMSWLSDPRFIVGTVLFIAGFIINRWADNSLRGLRKPGETDYKVPYGGLYQYISAKDFQQRLCMCSLFIHRHKRSIGLKSGG